MPGTRNVMANVFANNTNTVIMYTRKNFHQKSRSVSSTAFKILLITIRSLAHLTKSRFRLYFAKKTVNAPPRLGLESKPSNTRTDDSVKLMAWLGCLERYLAITRISVLRLASILFITRRQ